MQVPFTNATIIETKIGHPRVDNQSRYLAECGRDLTRVPELDGYLR